MRHFASIITYAAALLSAGPAIATVTPTAQRQANAGTCYTVGDSDARSYCLARAHRDPARCYSIQKPDLRALCRAEVGR